MLTKDSKHIIEITGSGSDGEGIGKVEGFTVFVPYAMIGETVEVQIEKCLVNHAFGKLLSVIKPSPRRMTPECEYFYKCGGCSFWHTDYSYELQYKTQKVNDCIRRIGKIDAYVYDIIDSDITRYRNKAQFQVTRDGIGFYAQGSHKLQPIEKCIIQHVFNDKIIRIVKDFMIDYAVSPYDEHTHSGDIRTVFTRVSSEKEKMVAIVTRTKKLPHTRELVNRFKSEGITSVIHNINEEETNVILGDKSVVLYGKDKITEVIDGLIFEVSLRSFFQVNRFQTTRLYEKVAEFANLRGVETVLDLFCGTGTISLFLARYAKKVIGVECVPEAIADAKRNARLNKIKNAEFIVGKAEDVTPKLERADVVILDPPRKGCDEFLLHTISDLSPEKIVYVSCNPATLARDLNTLQFCGYKVSMVQPIDMFPRTAHVETVVLLMK